MRTFISIDIPENIQEEIRKIQDMLPEFYGKKTKLENLHLTLKFLGEIDNEKIIEVKKKLSEIKYKRFETEVKYLGFFDNVKRGKRHGPVWLYLSNCEGLQKVVDDSLENLFERERRFMSHLTIARVKILSDKDYFFSELKKIRIPRIKFNVNEFELKKSVLKSEEPFYEDIEVYNLRN